MAKNSVVKIQLFSKVATIKVKGKEKKIRNYWTYMNLLVKGEEDKGIQKKSVTVKFRQDVDNDSDYELDEIKNGILECVVNAPFIYEIKEDADGKHYPELWVRQIYDFKPKESYHQQSDFFIEEEAQKTPYDDGYGYEEPNDENGVEIKMEDSPENPF